MAIQTKPDSAAAVPPRSPEAARAWLSLWLPALLLFLGTGAVYLLTQTRANTFDAVSYANQIAHLYPRTHNLRWLFHPHHLLFNALGWGLWRAARGLGYVGGSLPVLQTWNGVLGAAGVSVFYLTLRQSVQRCRTLPLLAALGLAGSFGYWICATDGRVNMPSLFFLLCAFWALTRTIALPSLLRSIGAGVLAGAAVLMHESAGLFLGVVLTGVWLAEANPLLSAAEGRRAAWQRTAACAAAWGITVAVPYLIVGIWALGLHSVSSFRAWSNEYAELGWWWDFRVFHNLRLDLYALRHAAFVEPPGKAGTFHLTAHIPLALKGLYFASLLGWLAAVYAWAAALPLLWRSHNRPLMSVCVVWAVLYGMFFTVWSPGYFVFWVPVLAPTGVLLALALAHYRARRGGVWVNGLLGIWIVLYSLLNWQAGIKPHLAPASDPFRRIAADVRAHTAPGDAVLVAGAGDGGPVEVALPYFADRAVISLHGLLTRARDNRPAALSEAQAQMDAALSSGHAVYALDEVIPGPAHNRHTQAALLHRHGLTTADLSGLLRPYTRTLAWQSGRGPVWRLAPKPAAPKK